METPHTKQMGYQTNPDFCQVNLGYDHKTDSFPSDGKPSTHKLFYSSGSFLYGCEDHAKVWPYGKVEVI